MASTSVFSFQFTVFANQVNKPSNENSDKAISPSQSTANNCSAPEAENYFNNIGTPQLANPDFKFLARCSSQSIPLLEKLLNCNDKNIRAKAAYVLGEVMKETEIDYRTVNIFGIIRAQEAIERDPDVLQILQHTILGFCRKYGFATANAIKQKIQSRQKPASRIICSLPKIHRIFPWCR